MNKLATLILWPTIIAVLLGLGFLWLSRAYGTTGGEEFVGQNQLSLISQSLDAEKKLIYNDILIAKVARKTEKEIAAKFYPHGEEYFSYPILQIELPEEQIKQQFFEKVSAELDEKVENSPYRELKTEFDYFITKNRFVALGRDIAIPFTLSGPKFTVERTIEDVRETLIGSEESLQKQPLVDISDFVTCSSNLISEGRCKLRQSVAEKLRQASEAAQRQGYKLLVTSAYRSLEDQQRAWIQYGQDPDTVARPSLSSPHVIGGSVDLCLVGINGVPTRSCSRLGGKENKFYSDEHTVLLERIMCSAGFVRWSGEWWHFEYGTRRWERGELRNACVA